jgi:hypothetical protein
MYSIEGLQGRRIFPETDGFRRSFILWEEQEGRIPQEREAKGGSPLSVFWL